MSLYGVGREGALHLTFARPSQRTILTENYSRPPLQVMRAIEDAAGCLCVYLLSPTGGVVQHDRYDIRVRVNPHAHALITTQSATKVYRMPDGCAEQHIRLHVAQDAICEFVPDAVILFAESHLQQTIEVTLESGALLILYEIVMPGRLAMGECLQFRQYVNRIVVRDENGLLLYDAAQITPSHTNLSEIGVLEGYPCWGNLYVVGDLTRWKLDAKAFCLAHVDSCNREGAMGRLSPLHRGGFCARMLSHRLETIYAAFSDLREIIRTAHLGLSPAPLRK